MLPLKQLPLSMAVSFQASRISVEEGDMKEQTREEARLLKFVSGTDQSVS